MAALGFSRRAAGGSHGRQCAPPQPAGQVLPVPPGPPGPGPPPPLGPRRPGVPGGQAAFPQGSGGLVPGPRSRGTAEPAAGHGSAVPPDVSRYCALPVFDVFFG